ncbi:hypothetical protein Aduo_013726 [Ancylostoma duodenale]
MRLLASTGRFLSRIGSTRSYEMGSSPVARRRSPASTYQIVRRPTTTGAFHSLDKIIIEDSHAALEIAARLTREEQSLLREALEDLAARQDLVSDDSVFVIVVPHYVFACCTSLVFFFWCTYSVHLFICLRRNSFKEVQIIKFGEPQRIRRIFHFRESLQTT